MALLSFVGHALRSRWFWVGLFAVGLGGLVVSLDRLFPDALSDAGSAAALTFYLLLMTLFGASMLFSERYRPGEIIRYTAIWAAIWLAVVFVVF